MKKKLLLLAFAGLVAGANAGMVTTNYYYETADNAIAAGVEAGYTGIQVSGWKDSAFRSDLGSQGLDGSEAVHEKKTGFGAIPLQLGLISFGDLGIADSSTISTATLHLWIEAAFGSGTWDVRGLSASDADWNEATAVYATKDGSTTWSGGSVEQSLSGSYGSFSTTDNHTGFWQSIDLTDAAKDYVNGNISGIAFINDTGVNGTSVAFNFSANENAATAQHGGLELVVIPEPSAISLIVLCGSGIIVGRRMFKRR